MKNYMLACLAWVIAFFTIPTATATDEVFDYQLAYNQEIAAPVAKPGVTNVILSINCTVRWFIYPWNPTDHTTNYTVHANGGFYLIKGQTVWTGGIQEIDTGVLPPFTSEYVALFDQGEFITESFNYPLIYWPGELNSWQQPHTLKVEPRLFVSGEGCEVTNANLVPGNAVHVTITYQYPTVVVDDCDDDDDHGDDDHDGGHKEHGHHKGNKDRSQKNKKR